MHILSTRADAAAGTQCAGAQFEGTKPEFSGVGGFVFVSREIGRSVYFFLVA